MIDRLKTELRCNVASKTPPAPCAINHLHIAIVIAILTL